MADPLFVILDSGDPDGYDAGFAWACVASYRPNSKAQFYRNRKKPGAAVQDATVLPGGCAKAGQLTVLDLVIPSQSATGTGGDRQLGPCHTTLTVTRTSAGGPRD